jgi:hypothetical protein
MIPKINRGLMAMTPSINKNEIQREKRHQIKDKVLFSLSLSLYRFKFNFDIKFSPE